MNIQMCAYLRGIKFDKNKNTKWPDHYSKINSTHASQYPFARNAILLRIPTNKASLIGIRQRVEEELLSRRATATWVSHELGQTTFNILERIIFLAIILYNILYFLSFVFCAESWWRQLNSVETTLPRICLQYEDEQNKAKSIKCAHIWSDFRFSIDGWNGVGSFYRCKV